VQNQKGKIGVKGKVWENVTHTAKAKRGGQLNQQKEKSPSITWLIGFKVRNGHIRCPEKW